QEATISGTRIDAHGQLMAELERTGLLNRTIEQLPRADELLERARTRSGLLKPELSVLLTYAKQSLMSRLLASPLPDEPAFQEVLRSYFPPEINNRFGHLIPEHPLRRELVATLVANRVINSEGITFVSRLVAETGSTPEDVVRAYRVARAVTDAGDRWRSVELLVDTVDSSVQRELLTGIDELVEEVTRWQLIRADMRSVEDRIAAFHPGFIELAAGIRTVGPEQWIEAHDREHQRLVDSGVPAEVAVSHIYQRDLRNGCDIIEVAFNSREPVLDVAHIFIQLGSALQINRLMSQVAKMQARTYWQRQALRVISDDLVLLLRRFSERVVADSNGRTASAAVDHYLAERTQAIGHLARFFRNLTVDGAPEVASLIVAVRRIEQLLRS
ncbi:MAG: NAD-glutamate dehydrogenase, partial [Acidimicrobiia bacterium]|nr:NAD-glutamate dehydrogenase [Acidimicrobiia bacterium]